MKYASAQRIYFGPTPTFLPVALVVSSSTELGRLYGKVLAQEFRTIVAPHEQVGQMTLHTADVILVDIEGSPSPALIIRSLTQVFPGVPVFTSALSLPEDALQQLMKSGACGHINRKLTRAQDIITIVKQTLFNNP